MPRDAPSYPSQGAMWALALAKADSESRPASAGALKWLPRWIGAPRPRQCQRQTRLQVPRTGRIHEADPKPQGLTQSHKILLLLASGPGRVIAISVLTPGISRRWSWPLVSRIHPRPGACRRSGPGPSAATGEGSCRRLSEAGHGVKAPFRAGEKWCRG